MRNRQSASSPIPIIDLFAGPGGLGEGFSAIRDESGRRRFHIASSIEKDSVAHRTLSLRAMFRYFDRPEEVPEAYYAYLRGDISRAALEGASEMRSAVKAAANEARCATLGGHDTATIDAWIKDGIAAAGDWVLIGGPPCQAYSLVGRARQTNVDRTIFEQDDRHYLYREYLRILKKFRPAIFVMENVRGILSAKLQGARIFPRILDDLKLGGEYEIRSFVTGEQPEEDCQFVIRAERFGLPQARHRVILLGVRKDHKHVPHLPLDPLRFTETCVADVLWELPAIRSRLSPQKDDSLQAWRRNLASAMRHLRDVPIDLQPHYKLAIEGAMSLWSSGGRFVKAVLDSQDRDSELMRWLRDPRLRGWCNHDSRGHMPSDLHRYLYAAVHAHVEHSSPNVHEFPKALWPEHKNLTKDDPPFLDRFRVQVGFRPSTTVVSHISKDGHYFIHPDPSQARSLTVREAARLQTFPDNYFFEGERTDQFTQVGNAVPPFLARQLAEVVSDLLSARAARFSEVAA